MFRDVEGLKMECDRGCAINFDGKTLMHPDQIDVAASQRVLFNNFRNGDESGVNRRTFGNASITVFEKPHDRRASETCLIKHLQ